MLIEVIQKDIDSGIKGSPSSCPISLAVKREHPKYYDVGVGVRNIWWNDVSENYRDWKTIRNKGNFSVTLPKIARQFIIDFDYDKKVKPFTFEV